MTVVLKHTAAGSLKLFGCANVELKPADTFIFNSQGGDIIFSGAANVEVPECVNYAFTEGETVYICAAARKKGKLQSISIKKVIIHNSRQSFGQNVVVYLDTTNRAWMENELCSKQNALALAVEYNTRKAGQIQKILNKSSC